MKLHLKLHFLVSTLAALMLSLAALPALAAPGDIDPGFNGGVPAVLDFNLNNPSGDITPYAAAMNPITHDILWTGAYYDSTIRHLGEIAVYKPDGTLDPAVGGGTGEIGLTADQAGTSFTGGGLYLYAIAVDSQGRILAAGEVVDSGSTVADMVLARYKPDGTLDTGFNSSSTTHPGIVVAPLKTYASGNGLSLTADGHILVTGDATNAGGTQDELAVWRFNPDGTADTAFGSNGHVQIAAVSDSSYATCIPALQPGGALIVGCSLNAAASWMLTRLTADGTVDTAFGTNGFITGAANMGLGSIALAPDGGFVISESDQSSTPPPVDLRRYLADGTVDTGFHSGSPLQLIALPESRFPVAVQPDGKILFSSNDGGNGLYIVRYLANGQGDTSFGSGGTSDIKFSSINGHDYTPYPTALLLQGNGSIVASGLASSTAGSNHAAFVTRVLSDTYNLTPSAPAFNDVTRAPLGQAVASNAVTVSGVNIGGNTSVNVALVTTNGKYGAGGSFAGGFTGTNVAWAPAGSQLALEQMTPTTGGTDTTTTVVLGGFWAANNYEVPLGSPATASWTSTTDQPPVASDGTLSATTGKAATGTLTATNPSSGTLAFAIVTPPAHGTATLTNAATGAYSYTSASGYTGTDSFTWKVNDGVADSNLATVNVTVKAAPPSPGGGGGGFGPLALLALLLLALVPGWLRRRGPRSTSSQPTEDIPMKSRLKLRFLVSTAAALMLSLAALPAFAAATTAAHGIGFAPAGLVAAIARTQAQAAAGNPAYAIGKNGCAKLGNRNNAPVLSGCFARTGPAFSSGRQTIRLRLTAWGRAGQLHPLSLVRTAPQANRIEYRGLHIAEWWRVLPLGYEQGFTLNQAPAGTGEVVLQLTASAAPTVHAGPLAWGRLRYGKLHVTDAHGTVLPATLTARGKIITLAFNAAHARYPVTIDPLVWMQQQEVIDSGGAANDNFGTSVALSGDGNTALVGDPDKTVNSNAGQGAAYVYTLAGGGTWSQTAELTDSGGAAYDYFGGSVALSANGTTALVGAVDKTINGNTTQGAAYVYTLAGGTWSQAAELTAVNGAAYDRLGGSVMLSANGATALVGASWKTVGVNSAQGAAYVFTTTNNWTTNTQAELTASDGAANDKFGHSVALSGDGATTLVGADYKTLGISSKGAAYVYTLTSGTWSQAAELTASAGDIFGWSVALSANGATALVGSELTVVGGNADQGAAYVFTTTDNWTTNTQAELTASDGAANDEFGSSVALSANGATALVGAYVRGTAYVYIMPTGGWASTATYTAKLTVTGAANYRFGWSAALSANGATALVGAPFGGSNIHQGAAYFFTGSNLSAVLSAPTTVQINTQFSSQYILTNAGTTASVALVVSLPVPVTGAGYVSASASQGTCSYDSTTKVATCALGSIPGNGGTASATLNLKATGAAGSTIAQSGQLANGSPHLAQTANTTIVLPPPPTLSGLGNVTVTAPTAGSEAFTIAGTGTLTVTASSSNPTLLPNANISGASSCIVAGSCTLTLTPAGGQTGSVAVIVTVTDAYNQSVTGAFTFTVQPAPTSPVANNLTLTTYENSAISTNLSAGAPNGDTLSYAIAAQPTHGAVTVNATTGAFTYTPASGYSGSDSFTFKATDTVTTLVSNTATVSITVNPTPPPGQVPPVASNLTLTTYTGQALSGTLPAVVTPSSDTLSYAIAAQPTHGTVTVTATTGAFTYTPNSGYSGSDSFTFTAKDTVTGLSSNIATVSITVNPTPPPGQVPPVASNLTLTTYTGQALSGILPAVVTPSSDTLSYAVTQPTNGTVTVTATTGAFTYTPSSGYSGSDSFTFTAKDTVTGLTSNIATVKTTIKATPSSPASGGGSGGGGGFGPLALFGLLLIALVPWWLRRRGTRSNSTQLREDIPIKLQLKLRFLVSTSAALMLSLAALPAFAATTAAHGIGFAPAGLVAAIARTQAQAAAGNPAYAIGKNGCAQLGNRNNAPVLSGCFGHTGPAFSMGKQTIRLRLTAWGRAGQLHPLSLVRTAPQANRIEYRGLHIAEWWRVLPLGYEQGFTLNQAPAGTGEVVLQLTASAAPTVHAGPLAWGRLRYGKLHVTDAHGTVLPATLTARGKIITLAFNAAHARYPVTIDPLVWLQQEVSAADGAAGDEFGTSVALAANGTTALVGADNKTVGGNNGQGAAYVYTLSGGTWSQAAELTAADGAAFDWFGSSVALSTSGATALVGANDKTVGTNGNQGAAYVYTEPSGGWATTSTFTAELTAADGAANDHFGSSVALSGDGVTALVGVMDKTVSSNADQGASYVYTAPSNGWATTSTFTAELTASNGAANDQFGISVALSTNGTTALMGANGKNSNQGASYVYTAPSNGWATTSTFTAELTASNGAALDWFGTSVALSTNGATALVGAWGKTVGTNTQQGAAYVYAKPSGGWATTSTFTAELTASNSAAYDDFGLLVALSGDGTTALVMVPTTVGGNHPQGTAYVYTAPGSGWATTSTFTAELTAASGKANNNLFNSVALSGDGTTALVGAPFKFVGGNNSQGVVYFFNNNNTDFSAVLSAPTTVVPGGRFDSQYILTNNGSSASADAQVALQAPNSNADVVAVSSTGPNGVFGCTLNSSTQTVTCDLGSIPGNGGTGSATLTLQATGALNSSIGQNAWLAASPNLMQSATTTINNSAPVASDLSLTTYAGQALSGTLPAIVTPSSDALSYAIAAQPTHGAVTVNAASGAFTYTPATGYSGSDSFTFTAKDTVTGLVSNTATVTITVNATPPPGQVPPVASNLTLTTYTGQALSGTLPAVVTPSSDTLSYAIAAQPTHGTVTVSPATGAFTYTPASGYSGSDSFTFTAIDTVTLLDSNTATVSITVNAVPPPGQVPPVASNLTLTTYTGQALSGTLPAVVTPSSDTLSYAIAQPTNGTVTVNATTGTFTYTPSSGYSGSDSFTFTAKDTVTTLVSNTATVAITIKATPPSPAPSGGGGGGFGPLALLALLLLALVPGWLRLRGFRSTPTQSTEDIPMKSRLKLRFLVSTLAALMLSLAALPALATPGAVDPAFNGGTPVILDMTPSATFQPYAAAMNPLNGDILWTGHYQTPVDLGGAINVYRPDGSFDPAVGSNGEIGLTADQAGFIGGNLYFNAIAVDSQGRILATGEVDDQYGVPTMVLARFMSGGSLDPGFGGKGTGIVTDALNNYAFANGLSLTADGHILVTGEAADTGVTQSELTVWRFNPDGTTDTAFGSNGHVQIAAVSDPGYETCFPALQPDGALIVGCQLHAAGSWKLTRLTANGAVDTGFGSNGFVTGAANRSLAGLALAPDGGFVISELDTTASPYPLDLRRYLTDGTMDPNFNSGNPLALGFVTSGVTQIPVAVQPDGKILLSGNDGGYGLAIGRFLANGTADGSFGTSGKSDIPFSNIGGYDYTPYTTALLLQGDGKIVASGWANSTAGSGEAAFVTRVLSDVYDLTPTTPAFTAVTRAPLGQAVASNAVAVGGETIGGATSGVNVALVTANGKYSISGAPFTGSFTVTNVAWAPAEGSLALEQMTPSTGGTATTTTVTLGGFWAANNYTIPLGSPATASWKSTTDQPPVASDGTLSATTGKATAGTLTATNPSSGTLAFAILTPPGHGTATLTNAVTGAYTYSSAGGYTGADSFTWKVNDGVADSNTASVSVTVKKAPSGGGGGGGFGPFALLGLLFLALVPWWLRRRGLRSTPTQPTDPTQLTEDIPMKLHLKLRFPVSIFAALALGFLTLPALAAPGTIDTTFNGGTPVILDMNSSGVSIDPYAAAMNPLNGDILWAGDYQNLTSQGGAITAYTSTGTFDSAVGNNGAITLTAAQAGFPGGELDLYAIAVDSQGRILAAGDVIDAGYTTWAMVLARFKPDGTLDTGFGAAGTGIVVDPLNTWAATATGLSLTADGYILVTGNAPDASHTAYPLTVWRFNPDGTPDTAFGSNGYVQIAAINISPFALFCFPALQPDGALIAGCAATGSSETWKLTRLQADGTVDTGFGTSGYLTGAANRQLTGLALAPDGGFVISEKDTNASPPPLDMRRYVANGTVDTGFNSGNPLALGFVTSGVTQVPVAVQPDGKILLSFNNGGTHIFVERYLATGTADTSFGTNGFSNIDFTNIGGFNYTPYPAALLLQGDGRIVASGWANSTAGGSEAAFVTRVLSDTYDLTPTTPAFTAVARAPLGQALASNAVTVGGISIGGNTSVNVALITTNGKYGSGGSFAGGFTGTNVAWIPAGSSLALEQMTPTTGGTDTTTTVTLGGFWAANNYEIPLGSPATASWTSTTDQPPVASDGTLSATTAKATDGTLSATNPSSGTLAFAIVVPPAHGTATITNAATGAYSYTSTAGYTGSDSFTWKVNDGVTDSNTATVSVTVNAAPSSGGGGGGLGPLALLGLLLLGLSALLRRPRVTS